MMTRLEQKTLKAVLMLRYFNTYSSKEEQLAEAREWYTEENERDLDDWIQALREDMIKTPEQREKESEEFLEWLLENEGEMEQQEMSSLWDDRDEWDDLWADRARSVGAVCTWR